MTLRHFQIFLCVCDEDGMTRAAEKLHISQPSVSQSILLSSKDFRHQLAYHSLPHDGP